MAGEEEWVAVMPEPVLQLIVIDATGVPISCTAIPRDYIKSTDEELRSRFQWPDGGVLFFKLWDWKIVERGPRAEAHPILKEKRFVHGKRT